LIILFLPRTYSCIKRRIPCNSRNNIKSVVESFNSDVILVNEEIDEEDDEEVRGESSLKYRDDE
jgi:hypothetical protein